MRLFPDRDAGPFDALPPLRLRPLPARPSFESVVADGLSNTAGLDAQFVTARGDLATVAGNVNDGFEGELAEAIGDGVNPPGDGIALDVATTIEGGDNLDGIRQSVADILPPPDTPIDLGFDAPPAPPANYAADRREDKNPPNTEGIES